MRRRCYNEPRKSLASFYSTFNLITLFGPPHQTPEEICGAQAKLNEEWTWSFALGIMWSLPTTFRLDNPNVSFRIKPVEKRHVLIKLEPTTRPMYLVYLHSCNWYIAPVVGCHSRVYWYASCLYLSTFPVSSPPISWLCVVGGWPIESGADNWSTSEL